MISRLPPTLKFAVGFVLAEFFLANPTQQFYQWLFSEWKPRLPEIIPPGLLVGIAIGLVACLYYVRHGEAGWWARFRYEQEGLRE